MPAADMVLSVIPRLLMTTRPFTQLHPLLGSSPNAGCATRVPNRGIDVVDRRRWGGTVKGDRVEIVVDAGGGTPLQYELVATWAGRRVETPIRR